MILLSVPCIFLIMCNVPSVWYSCLSPVHSHSKNQFTVQLYTKPVYSTAVHKTSWQYSCTQNQFTAQMYTIQISVQFKVNFFVNLVVQKFSSSLVFRNLWTFLKYFIYNFTWAASENFRSACSFWTKESNNNWVKRELGSKLLISQRKLGWSLQTLLSLSFFVRIKKLQCPLES